MAKPYIIPAQNVDHLIKYLTVIHKQAEMALLSEDPEWALEQLRFTVRHLADCLRFIQDDIQTLENTP